jgi:hypothetical protein
LTPLNQVLELIENQVEKCEEPLQYIFLVGGFAGNPYLLSRVKVHRSWCL